MLVIGLVDGLNHVLSEEGRYERSLVYKGPALSYLSVLLTPRLCILS